MEPTHWVLAGVMLVAIGIPAVAFCLTARMLRKDAAIDAATFLAIRRVARAVRPNEVAG